MTTSDDGGPVAGGPLFLEDLSVGQRFVSDEHRLSSDEIVRFGEQFDPQPFHTDAEAAEDTFFEGLAASGWHTMAITMRLVVESVPLADGIIGTGGRVAWPRPTRPGDSLRVTSEVAAITPSRSRPDRAIVEFHCTTVNGDGEVVLQLETTLLVFRAS